MPKHEIVRKRIKLESLIKMYPETIAKKIIEVANEYGNEGEMGIKTFLPQTVDTNHFWRIRENDRYIVMDASGKEIKVEKISQDVIGVSDAAHKLNNKFQIPAETYMIFITYYKKDIMKVYTCEAAEKLGPVAPELTAKMEKLELPANANKADITEASYSAKEMLNDIVEDKPTLVLPDAVLHLPEQNSITGEVVQAEIKPFEEKSDLEKWDKIIRPIETSTEQLPDSLVNTGIEDPINPKTLNTYDPTKREPKVMEPRKRRTKPLEVKPVSTPVSGLKAKSPDSDNLYHGEVVIVGIGKNEGKEVLATMKIGGRKWICLSGGWESSVEVAGEKLKTGNMKEIMEVYHTNFLRTNGSWKGNKDGNGWVIREDWLKKILETK